MQNLTFFFNSNVKVRETSQIKKEYSQNNEKPFTKIKTYNQLKEYSEFSESIKKESKNTLFIVPILCIVTHYNTF